MKTLLHRRVKTCAESSKASQYCILSIEPCSDALLDLSYCTSLDLEPVQSRTRNGIGHQKGIRSEIGVGWWMSRALADPFAICQCWFPCTSCATFPRVSVGPGVGLSGPHGTADLPRTVERQNLIPSLRSHHLLLRSPIFPPRGLLQLRLHESFGTLIAVALPCRASLEMRVGVRVSSRSIETPPSMSLLGRVIVTTSRI